MDKQVADKDEDPMPRTAAQRVWDLAELREEIILHLPLTDIIKVSAAWAVTSRVKAVLFQAPLATTRVAADEDDEWKNVTKKDHDQVEEGEQAGIPMAVQPVLNPFMVPHMRDEDQDQSYGIPLFIITQTWYDRANDRYISADGDNETFKFDPLRLREDASWRNMLVMQPAASSITVHCLGDYLMYDCNALDDDQEEEIAPLTNEPAFFEVRNARGVTFGELTNAMHEHHHRCNVCQAVIGYDPEYSWSYRGVLKLREFDSKKTGHEILAEIKKCIK